jgi:hypothetical protein
MVVMKIYVRILSLVIYGAMFRTMFHIAYLGMGKEHDGMNPSSEVTAYILLAVFFLALAIWNVVLIIQENIPYKKAQVIALSVMALAPIAYMVVKM